MRFIMYLIFYLIFFTIDIFAFLKGKYDKKWLLFIIITFAMIMSIVVLIYFWTNLKKF